MKETVYAVRYQNNDSKLFQSTSGGAFLGLAEFVISRGGAVYGAAYNDENEVEHIRVGEEGELWRLQGSKYVQSRIGDTYKLALHDLREGLNVLFTGTPCQIAGLRGFLGREYERLITMDFACHGVPSPGFFRIYLSWLERRGKEKIRSGEYIFRYKKYGWYYRRKMSYTLKFNNKVRHVSADPYYASFLKANNYRESCYSCPFRLGNYQSDITVGDFSNVDVGYPDFMDCRGVSYAILHTKAAKRCFEEVKPVYAYREVDFDFVVKNNSFLTHGAVRKISRSDFYKGMNTGDPLNFVDRIYQNIGFKTKVKSMIAAHVPGTVAKAANKK